ncbi:sodium:alanine symporter family protein [Anaerosalibacter massiliensis]|uniref:Sodium:alanine symporter family protein n=1 Tax=Anaerosalibacter massiliensis TaxID=1347392 RepID=A0A9X2MEU9_9FIRM|nr:sodium:alanine symporter family protein [Anaerosalibacter massiliensis]MCR2043657.1 sodium:alanine symporter family protein [Anaerosalibacter massiliensis]
MKTFEAIVSQGVKLAWGPVTIILLVGIGIYLSIATRFIQFRKMKTSLKLLTSKSDEGEGDLTPFQALMTSMAATIGTGNIAGVASAIVMGGPGAIFWMWVSGLFGGATKFAEGLLAVKYRITNEDGEKSGGPMYYISRGIKEQYGINASWLGWLFALFGLIASLGIGNMTQANAVSDSLKVVIGINPYISGGVIAVLTALVIIGGVKNIGKITEKIVPIMSVSYIVGSIIAILSNVSMVPTVFKMIFINAFTAEALAGGTLGTIIRIGVSRGMFSNEAGLGSAPIAHASSKNDDPVAQGIIASLDSFFTTIIICTMTAIVILTSELVTINGNGIMEIEGNLNGATLTTVAFDKLIPGIGGYIVTFGLIFFAFSTIIGWYYYGAKCIEYIAGLKAVNVYKWVWVVLSFVGAIVPLEIVWNLSDMFNGLMAIPNIIGLIALSPVVFKMTKEYDKKIKIEKDKVREQLTNPIG